VLSALGPFAIDLYLPALPRIADDLGTSASVTQLTLTACLLGLGAGQLVAGPISDRVGRRVPLIVGMLLFAVSSALCAVVPSAGALVALRFVNGLAGAVGIVLGRAVVRDLYGGARMARVFSRIVVVVAIAPAVAPVVGAQVLHLTSWRGCFVVLAAIGTALLVAALTVLPETLPPERRSEGGLGAAFQAYRRFLGDRAFLAYAVSSGLAFAAMFAYIAGSPFVLEDIHGLSPAMFSIVFGINGLGIAAVGQLNARLVRDVPMRRLLGIGLGVCAAAGTGLLIVVLAGVGLVGIIPLLFAVVASLGLVIPNSTALALEGYPDAAGAAAAVVGACTFLFGAAISPLVGIAGSQTAVPMAVIIATLSAGAAGLLAVLDRRPRGGSSASSLARR
jgi:DHA1 family bicyclomycin/chloramphenicol resistance-like MFS transporter